MAYSGYAHLDASTGKIVQSERDLTGLLLSSNNLSDVSSVATSLLNLGILGTPIVKLGTVTGIDLKSTGATTLYTVPSGKTAYITEILIRITAVSAFISGATLGVGKTPSYNEWLAATAMGALSSTSQFRLLSHSAAGLIYQSFEATEVVAVNVTVGAVSTTLTAACDVFGYLI